MKRLLLLCFFLLASISSLQANKVIYFSYEKVPSRVVKGEIFPVTFKTLSTLSKHKKIRYKFSNSKGLKFITTYQIRRTKGKYFYDTFYLQSTRKWARLPDVEASLAGTDEYNSTKISGQKLNVVTLNPRKNFSNIIANKLEVTEYKTTSYDANKNIIVIVATAKNSDINAMHFDNIEKQGNESITRSYRTSKIIYYIIVDKRLEKFEFTYFNLLKNKFSLISLPITVEDDSVTTQTDLKPKDQSHERIKMMIAGSITLILFVLLVWRRKYIYAIVLLFPLGYIIFLALPEKDLCIKEGSNIYLLPVHNGTIFETTSSQLTLQREGSVEGFFKVQLENKKIGWVKNEDICSY